MKFDFTLESVSVNLNGRVLEFYPLNFRALRVLAGELETLRASGDPGARFDAVCKVLAASANRKTKVISEEELSDMLSPDWANKIIEAVNKLSGFVKPEEPGDPKVQNPQNGAASTVLSSQPPDGVGSKLTN